MPDQYEDLDFAERWMGDGLHIAHFPGFLEIIEVDMTASKSIIEALRMQGIKGTYTHLFVRAAALALKRNHDLHQLTTATRRFYPEDIDIGLSVAGNSFVAPVMVINDSGRKSLSSIAIEIINNRTAILEKDKRQIEMLKQWGWLVPFSWLRRLILRALFSRFWFRRQLVGTFQVSCIADVDVFAPFMFGSSAILGTGCVRRRAVVAEGQVDVRPTVMISCCANHQAWDGARMARFLQTFKEILESGELAEEVETSI